MAEEVMSQVHANLGKITHISKFAYYLDEIMDIRRDIKNKKSYQES